MKTMQVREAKAHFSELLDAASKGEPTTITRHGEPVAVVVPVEASKKLYPKPKRSFVDHLLAFPGPLEIEKDRRPPREIDL
jgi:prevent-host-death family protein